MSLTPEAKREIRQEVLRQLNVILSGAAGDNSAVETEDIVSLYPGSPPIPKRPVMHPYGMASRAPKKTIQVTAKQGADAHNRMVLGHRDTLRKQLSLKEGETVIYGSDGETVLATVLVSADQGIRMTTDFGFWQWNLRSDMIFNTGTVKGTIGNGGTVVFQNATAEFTAAIVQLFTDVAQGLVTTILGPEPLVMPNFAADLAKLQTFVGTYQG